MKKILSHKRAVRLAIIGAGGMGNTHAKAFRGIADCELVAAVDVDLKRAQDFCSVHGIPFAFETVGEMLAGTDIDAASIVTPDRFHAPLSIQCLTAGKHVFCEKPLALNHCEAMTMVAAAREADRVNMVNFSYRNWPCIHAVATLVQKGVLGKIRHVEASYLQAWLVSKAWGDWHTSSAWLWRLSTKHGSKGALGDVGVHIVDFATYPAGPIKRVYCRLKTFDKAPKNRIGEYKLDANDSAVMTVEYASGAIGTIHTTRWMGGHANRLFLKISGTLGTIEIDSEKSTGSFRICTGKDLDRAAWREVVARATPSNYERFIASIRTGRPAQPDFARGAEVQRVLDACFESDASGMPVTVIPSKARFAHPAQ